ncbi:MMPL family transporter [Streptomyces sp. BE147]|uniref:MMPL family transporter n=1 Tax=Streptomyces sp. BE147 TaxID=3002524 RepID=UPI002E76B1CE|nr:MMPL family transporter [Streptomyces sp. BE147]MEE1740531.1 MMPL family transporter [Streptomyces sp. BE147]
MATFLHRLGRLSFRRRRLVVLIWLALLAAGTFAAVKAPAAADDGVSIPGTESQKAFDLLDQRFPGVNSDGAEARIVFVVPDGQKITASANRAAVEHVVEEVGGGSQVAAALSPFDTGAVSKDGTTAYATVSYKAKTSDLTDTTREALTDAAESGREAGLTVEMGGSALTPEAEMGATEIIGVAVAAVVLLITFGSLAAAGLPLLTALIGVGLGIAAITALGSTFGFSPTTATLAMMLGLAVGIDYAVFIVSRFRSERAEGHTAEEAAARANGTAGSAVVFAGLTVVIALMGLSVVGIPVLTKMGVAAAGTVVISVVIALTLLPALLGFAQRAVLPRASREPGSAASARPVGGARGARRTKSGAQDPAREKAAMGTRWARMVIRRPLGVLALAVLGLGVIAVPAFDLRLGMPGDETKSTSTTERRAYDALADGFGPGFNGPLTVVVDAKGSDDPKAAAAKAAEDLAATEGIVSVSPAAFNEAGDTAVITATPGTGPSSTGTKELVGTIRDEAAGPESGTGATLLVTGTTAVNIDVSQKVTDALVPYLAVVVGLAVLLLMVVFRSLLVPVKAAVGFLLSVGASFGVIVAVFQWGWLAGTLGIQETGPVSSLMPIFLIGVVFGLAMDYEVFLVTRMREAYVHGERPGQAIVTGFRHSARVVVAAAVIMIAVFAGFIGMSDSMVKMMGLGLASAVFFDAFVVRMTIVPAVLALLGDRAWWLPRRLGRILPNVDIEGAGLSRRRTAAPGPGSSTEPEPTRV